MGFKYCKSSYALLFVLVVGEFFTTFKGFRMDDAQHLQQLQDMSQPVALIPNGTVQFSLVVTRNCNLACHYCSQYFDADFSHEELVGVVENIMQRYPEGLVCIHFYGGEPLLRFSLIQSIFAYIEANYASRVEGYDLTTNAIPLTDEMVAFFVAHRDRFEINCSLDGGEDSNWARVFPDGSSSFDASIAGINKLRSVGLLSWVQAVATADNVQNIADDVEFLHGLGFYGIRVSLIEGAVLSQECLDTYVDEMKKVSDYVILHPDLSIVQFKRKFLSVNSGPFILVNGKLVAIRVPGNDLASRLSQCDVRDPTISGGL